MIELIPAIDIMNGRCVRLSRGDYSCRKVYDENPLEVAKAFQDNGLNRLHLVDLDGAKADHVVNYRTLEQIATHTTLSVDFGGGIKSDEDLRIAFECGADMVTGGSIAVKNRSLFLQWLVWQRAYNFGCRYPRRENINKRVARRIGVGIDSVCPRICSGGCL